jgi:hypothetical protein
VVLFVELLVRVRDDMEKMEDRRTKGGAQL